MGIKYYAAIDGDIPQHIVVSIVGAVEEEDGLLYTRPFDSPHHLSTLIGTLESRMEREGLDFGGACILPYGAKVPETRGKLKVFGPLSKTIERGIPEPYQILEMRTPYNRFYAVEEEQPQTIIIAANRFYPRGLTAQDIRSYYRDNANKIIAQYNSRNLDGTILLRASEGAILKCRATQEIMEMRIDATNFNTLNHGRTVEFRFAAGPQTNLLWLDIDPQPLFPWVETKRVAEDLLCAMGSLDEAQVVGTELRFSGKAGFYVLAHIAHPLDIDEARMVVRRVAEQYIKSKNDKRITTNATDEAESIRIDCTTMRKQDGLRMAYSLAYPTGLMCMPLTPKQLTTFERNMAAITPISVQGAEQENQTTGLQDEIIKKLGLSSERVQQLRLALDNIPPVELAQVAKKSGDIDAVIELDGVFSDAIAVIREVGNRLDQVNNQLGLFAKIYHGRSDFVTPVVTKVRELQKFKKFQELVISIASKIKGKVVSQGEIKQEFVQHLAKGKVHQALALIEDAPKEGYRMTLARTSNLQAFAMSMATKLDAIIELLDEAQYKVPKHTFFRKGQAEAVMEYPMVNEVETEEGGVEELVSQIVMGLSQVNTDLETAILIAQYIVDDLNLSSSSIEAKAAEEAIIHNPTDLMLEYSISPEEMDSLNIWLGRRERSRRMTPQDIDNVLGLRERLSTPVFKQVVTEVLRVPILDPATLDKWLGGLEMLKEMPKYQVQSSEGQEVPPPSMHKMMEGIANMFDMYQESTPEQFQHYIKVVFGMDIPLEDLDDFMQKFSWGHPATASTRSKGVDIDA